ncbi:B12-binding domain-containing radical SAM protein [Fulvivirga lutea]|uniref:Radical SAM protein n=1 Tax=Fulvivirga lutea TaxID=2810512 RepID=A0A974WLC6_9BACT|nr:B12-binding domain-containing radical SAM protein [Fulvivirga lutea]QSE99352.1 radical SAM protein [Fulvivirga lutea]
MLRKLLLITPPFTQLNTPYPATAYLKGFLNTKNIDSYQMDLGIDVINELFTKKNLIKLFEIASKANVDYSDNSQRIIALREEYLAKINDVITFLQGNNHSYARSICTEGYLPQASRFNQLDDLEWAFGNMGMQDKAKHLATLFLEDLSDFIIECIDDNFGFSRYAERLGMSANSFDELHQSLQRKPSFIDQLTLELLEKRIKETQPKLVCFSVPFPGNLYSAFRCAQWIKSFDSNIQTAMGGGFPNTELRSVSDSRVFEYFDFITLDDGEVPIELLVENLETDRNTVELKRTFHLKDGKVFYNNLSSKPDYKQVDLGTPDYSDLHLGKYISFIEIANPMHSLWSDGRWNKLTMAHGCYWGKCTFCDISLDYIKLYEPIAAKILVDRMENLITQTGDTGFHFVDEAAPPALMRELALEIVRRKITVTWWTNIRFEKSFTYDLCQLLKASGCIAVSGGLEVASDRLLKLIDKGVTVEQVAKVTRNFTEAGIMVHAYLMYGYPTQTVQETVDSLEMVRQMFEQGIIQSGFWHQFALTAHSPVGLHPELYGVTPEKEEITFAHNDVQFTDSTGIDHDQFSYGLKKSLFNYMHGLCFEFDLQEWFDFNIPQTTIPEDFILNSLEEEEYQSPQPSAKVIWVGNTPTIDIAKKNKKAKLIFHNNIGITQLSIDNEKVDWVVSILNQAKPESKTPLTLAKVKKSFEEHYDDFEIFWYSKPINTLRKSGLLVI